MDNNEATKRPWAFMNLGESYWVGHFPDGEQNEHGDRNKGEFVGGWSFKSEDDKAYAETALNSHDQLVAALEAVEWVWQFYSNTDHGGHYICPECENERRYNVHNNDCQLAAALGVTTGAGNAD